MFLLACNHNNCLLNGPFRLKLTCFHTDHSHSQLTHAGKFTTRPYDVRFFLSEIVEHMPDAIPCQSMLFVHSETASELPSHLVTAVVTLTETSVETSLVATTPDVEDFKDAAMFDIPLDLDIEVW